MIIKQTTDKAIIKEIMTHPEIWEAITNDGCDIEKWEPREDYMYILGTIEGKAVGLFIIHMTDIGIHQCHVQLLPDMRKLYSLEFGKITMEWFWNNTKINKLFALIPDIYPNVKKFAELQGFHQEGLITKSHVKNGALCSQWFMSINRGK